MMEAFRVCVELQAMILMYLSPDYTLFKLHTLEEMTHLNSQHFYVSLCSYSSGTSSDIGNKIDDLEYNPSLSKAR